MNRVRGDPDHRVREVPELLPRNSVLSVDEGQQFAKQLSQSHPQPPGLGPILTLPRR